MSWAYITNVAGKGLAVVGGIGLAVFVLTKIGLTHEDWRLLLTAVVGAVTTIYLEILRQKQAQAAGLAKVAADKADTAAVKAEELKRDVNGRMEALLAEKAASSFAAGKIKGVATVAAAVAADPAIPLDAQAVAAAVAKIDPSVSPPAK